jgi:hypothetical protein
MLSRMAQRVLIDAASILSTKGWTQFVSARKGGLQKQCSAMDPDAECFCLSGALYFASKKNFQTGIYSEEAFASITDFLGRCPVVWNDQPGRTKEEVVQVLLKVAHAE